jgi:hypothetical protein
MSAYNNFFKRLILPTSNIYRDEIQDKFKLKNFKKWDSNWHNTETSANIFPLNDNNISEIGNDSLPERIKFNQSNNYNSDVIRIIRKILLHFEKQKRSRKTVIEKERNVSEHVYEM